MTIDSSRSVGTQKDILFKKKNVLSCVKAKKEKKRKRMCFFFCKSIRLCLNIQKIIIICADYSFGLESRRGHVEGISARLLTYCLGLQNFLC